MEVVHMAKIQPQNNTDLLQTALLALIKAKIPSNQQKISEEMCKLFSRVFKDFCAITWLITGNMSAASMLDVSFNIRHRALKTSVSLVAKFIAFHRIYLATSKKKEGAYSALQSAPGLNGTPCGCVTAPFVRGLTVACSHHRHH